MRTRLAWLVASVLFVLSIGIFLFKVISLQFPLEPDVSSESWHIEARLAFIAKGEPIKAKVFLPRFSKDISIVDENFVSDGYGFDTYKQKKSGNRVARWSKRNAKGKELLFYRGIIYEADTSSPPTEKAPKLEGPFYGSKAFEALTEDDPVALAVAGIIEDVYERSADKETFASELLQVLDQEPPDKRLEIIRQESSERVDDQSILSMILGYANIPSRVMHGIRLTEDQRDVPIESWVEVYGEDGWVPVSDDDEEETTQGKRLLWWSGADPLFKVEGGRQAQITISVKRHLESVLTEAIWKGDNITRGFYNFSVYSLPLDVQLVFSVLLLIPLGGLVVSFMRQIIGVKTFGTFTPILVAVAFRETQLFWGIILFASILTLGMVCRALLSRMQLLMVPRLSATLASVVVIIYFLMLFTHKSGINAGLSISLFPIVIIVMIIERMSITWEEYGAREAMISGAGSLFVAICGYLVMVNDYVSHMVVTFPELLLSVVALNILIGRYNGFKLTEYMRFRSIGNAS